MTRSARRSLVLAALGGLVLVASGLEVRCDGATAQTRTTLSSLQAEIDMMGLRIAMLEAGATGYQLKGFSATNVAGSGGVLAMTAACAATFPGSRMCTSREVLETRNVPTISTSNDAWVRPSFSPFAGGGTPASIVLDESGLPSPNAQNTSTNAEDMSCRGWNAGGVNGLGVNRDGRFRLVGCSGNRPVACCGP